MLQASDGDVRIIGDKQKAKHEVATAGSRVSITLYRSGSAAGCDGPTGFLPPGVRRKTGYDEAFLIKHGAALGSTLVMTPTGYMTEEAWVEIAPSIAAGIRQMPVIRDNPDWWVLKVIDGFGPHTSSEKAMAIYMEHKIVLVKEEGDTSHACQVKMNVQCNACAHAHALAHVYAPSTSRSRLHPHPPSRALTLPRAPSPLLPWPCAQAYDQEVAKADKRSMRDALSLSARPRSSRGTSLMAGSSFMSGSPWSVSSSRRHGSTPSRRLTCTRTIV